MSVLRSVGPRSSPLRGRYLVHNAAWNALLWTADHAIAAIVRRGSDGRLRKPRRVLLAVGGHLGDAVIATAALSLLRRALPSAEIGMVLGSWARPAIESHPDLRWIHTVDHWKMNRSGSSLAARWLHDRRTRRRALSGIRSVDYDAAVDLYMYYPNMAGLLWRAGIPIRVGYASGGFGALYTHTVSWLDTERHTALQQATLLRVLVPSVDDADATGYDLPPVPAAARQRAESVICAAGAAPGEYLVVHMGAGSAIKEWPPARWRELVERLTADGHRILLTGAGQREARQIASVAGDLPGCVDLSGQLDWHGFVHVLACAELVLCVDTVAAHVAAAVGTPCVALWTGTTRTNHWRPLGSRSTVVMNEVPCAPCFRSRGCETMACIRDVSVDSVLEAVRRLSLACPGSIRS